MSQQCFLVLAQAIVKSLLSKASMLKPECDLALCAAEKQTLRAATEAHLWHR